MSAHVIPFARHDQPAGSARDTIRSLPRSLIRDIAGYGSGFPGTIPLWFGEPDQPTPDFICRAAAEALAAGHTQYAPARGIEPLRKALATHMAALHGSQVETDRVVVTASGMQAAVLAVQALVETGNRVVFVTPGFPNLEAVVSIMGGVPGHVPLRIRDGAWRLDIDELISSLDGAKAVFLNSPHNPTGWTLSSEEQVRILEACRARGVWVIADEVYNRLYFAAEAAPSFLAHADADDRVLVLNSFSKTYAMTGWRIGWITAPRGIVGDIEKLNEFNIGSAATFSQHAAVAAIEGGERFVDQTVGRYRIARDIAVERIGALTGCRFGVPEGAIYLFFQVEGLTDSIDLARTLVREAGVGLAPGRAFGPAGEGHLRLCFAKSPETLIAAIDRLAAFFDA